jgi:hypothetical protein
MSSTGSWPNTPRDWLVQKMNAMDGNAIGMLIIRLLAVGIISTLLYI